MAFKNIKGNTRNSLLDYFVSGKAVQYHSHQFGGAALPPSGLTATGGVINDYTTTPGAIYRAHIFTSSGTFDITALSTDPDLPDTVEYLVVGGGGGGGGDSQAGGGGAGGFRTNLAGHPKESVSYPVTVQSYVVTVGAGGVGGTQAPGEGRRATNGGNSEFYPPAHTSYPAPQFVRGAGGGGGLGYGAVPNDCLPGGSGGGTYNESGGTGVAGASIIDSSHPIAQGNAGGDSPEYSSPYAGGGGGGAGRAGAPDSPSTPLGRSTGGYGLQCLIAGSPSNPQPVGAPGPGSGASATGYFAGGGGGGGYQAAGAAGGYGGGGNGGGYGGATPVDGGDGTVTSGGGGGGARNGSVRGGRGGSGVVVFRYQIGQLTAEAKATGGAISYYNGLTIHTFANSGDFVVGGSAIPSAEVFLVGGGGAGGGGAGSCGGGGGAGGTLLQSSVPFSASTPYSIIVGAGGGISGSSDSGYPGTDTTLTHPGGPYVAGYGGGGGGNSNGTPAPLGSGGGGGVNGTSALTGGPQGNSGGSGINGTWRGAGGGGGRGGAGQNGSGPNGQSGYGGIGVQIPPAFRNPQSATSLGAPGPGGSNYWVAGGGGGGSDSRGPLGVSSRGLGGGPGGPFAGAGDGVFVISSPFASGESSQAEANTGSGGGGGGYATGGVTPGGNGGSGIVLIAYPS